MELHGGASPSKALRIAGCPTFVCVHYHNWGCPTFRDVVQSHDILYKMSRDILYTPGARSAPG